MRRGRVTRGWLVDGARIAAWKSGDGRPHLGRGPQQDWPVAGLQLTYSIAFFLLLFFCEYNRFSLDAFRNQR
jgi:hypothetical protein